MKAYLLALLLTPAAPEFISDIYSRGALLQKPDLAFVTVDVKSSCYLNKDDENSDHLQVADGVRNYMSQFGQELRYQPLLALKTPDFEKSVPKNCQNISTRLTRVTLRSKDMENFFTYIYDQLQREIPNRAYRRGFAADSPNTVSLLQIPWAEISDNSRQRAESEARALALNDAVTRVKSYVKSLGFKGDVEVFEIIDTDKVSQNDQSRKNLLGPEFLSPDRLTFLPLDITAQLRVRFRFVGSSRVNDTEGEPPNE